MSLSVGSSFYDASMVLRRKPRHEMPEDKDDPMAKQNIKDRYHGRNDPVARKMLSGFAATKNMIPPEDPSVVRLVLNSDLSRKHNF